MVKKPIRADVIIFSHQRSGTHFLQASLASHADVVAIGEFILKYRRSLAGLSNGKSGAKSLSHLIEPDIRKRLIVGIVMYSQLAAFEELYGSIEQFAVLHLVRNPAAVARSVVQMHADREAQGADYKAHYKVGESVRRRVRIREEAIARVKERVMILQHHYGAHLRNHPDVLTISYEELTGNRQTNRIAEETAERLLDFLCLETQPLTNNLLKTGTP